MRAPLTGTDDRSEQVEHACSQRGGIQPHVVLLGLVRELRGRGHPVRRGDLPAEAVRVAALGVLLEVGGADARRHRRPPGELQLTACGADDGRVEVQVREAVVVGEVGVGLVAAVDALAGAPDEVADPRVGQEGDGQVVQHRLHVLAAGRPPQRLAAGAVLDGGGADRGQLVGGQRGQCGGHDGVPPVVSQ
ncbi:hypothetical protein [Geodermatophilus sp. SYSU D00766]